MTSDRAYVWVWLPGETEPIPAGLLAPASGGLWFTYGTRYLARPEAVSLYAPELPLTDRQFPPSGDLGMPGALRDASPDSWGRRVINSRLFGDPESTQPTELTYLLASGSNRFGAVDFQQSATEYVPRDDTATLDELQQAARLVEEGKPVPPALAAALQDGTAIGGARPKALITDGGIQYIAKFSTSTDLYSVVGAEAAAAHLARRVGIEVPDMKVVSSLNRDVLLLRRFDRSAAGGRRMVVSALTMLGRDETTFRYGTYPDILDTLKRHSKGLSDVGAQLFRRIAFNIAISNTDDHLRNHAAFWDGAGLTLTPAYDLSPMNRHGETASQAIAYGREGERSSNLAELIRVARVYGLSEEKARVIVSDLIDGIRTGWDEAADFGRLTAADRKALWHRQFLNPGSLYGL
ncbi:type II toxin-antitoxin system HipA family toxin [Herbiconiux liukaitaii]|uniref:type II toxin-antitoxin system HipA family toxin n=1 Tax=Herbiconiux liukaitaii TaxID=3342799 RepID=UPI0035B863C1